MCLYFSLQLFFEVGGHLFKIFHAHARMGGRSKAYMSYKGGRGVQNPDFFSYVFYGYPLIAFNPQRMSSKDGFFGSQAYDKNFSRSK